MDINETTTNVETYNSLRKPSSHIQNAQASRASSTDVDKTKAAIAISNVSCQNRYTRGHRSNIQKPRKTETSLKYGALGPALCLEKNRYYIAPKKTCRSRAQLAPARSGEQQRTLIVPTSKGIIPSVNAHKPNVGGELTRPIPQDITTGLSRQRRKHAQYCT